MSELSNFQAPKQVESGANNTNKDLKNEDKDDLFVGLHFKLRELSTGFARVLHYLRIMSRVNHYTINPFCVFKWSPSQKNAIVVKRECILASSKVKSAFKLIQLVIRWFTDYLAS